MGNLKEIRTRISSVTSTKQITNAMKMVSAAKLKKAQDHILQLRPYSDKLQEILGRVSNASSDAFSEKREGKKVLLVAVSSNRGLCGAFNANIVKKIIDLKQEVYPNAQVEILAVGKKAHEGLQFKGVAVKEHFYDIFDHLEFDNTIEISESIIESFLEGQYDKVVLIYNQFKNAANQLVQAETFLPISATDEESNENNTTDYIFEPSQKEIMQTLIPKVLKTQFFKALLDSYASEHGARMTAMHKATDNAGELLNDLKLTYNKARQAAITNEILEIVGGAEALN